LTASHPGSIGIRRGKQLDKKTPFCQLDVFPPSHVHDFPAATVFPQTPLAADAHKTILNEGQDM